MSIQISETTWNAVAGAIIDWRRHYEAGNSGERPLMKPLCDLWDASELILHPPQPLFTRDVFPEGTQFYASGGNYARAVTELNKGNRNAAAMFMGYDVQDSRDGTPIAIDPASLRHTEKGIAFRYSDQPLPLPKTLKEAAALLAKHGIPNNGSPPHPDIIKRAVLAAAAEVSFAHANKAALIFAKAFGYEPSDVNPYPENSSSPWLDVMED